MGKVQVANGVKWAAVAALLLQGVVHLYEAPEMYGEVNYIGILFVATLVGAVVATVGMLRDERWGWVLALVTAGGPLLGYVLSRSVGIPMLRETEISSILEPLGVVCVVAEAIVVALAAKVLLAGEESAVATGSAVAR